MKHPQQLARSSLVSATGGKTAVLGTLRGRLAWPEAPAWSAWTDIDRLGVPRSVLPKRCAVRYGINPHQTARIVAGVGPRIVNGEPSMINYLDALNAYELVREADQAIGKPAAASFKHVSPAGAAVAGEIDPVAAKTWRVDAAENNNLVSAYVRARDADPKSSFGDVAAMSRPVDLLTAHVLRSVICDAVIAPGYEPGTVEVLAAKATIWWLRRHRLVDELPSVDGMRRQDRLNWQIRYAGREMTHGQASEFADLFGAKAASHYDDAELAGQLGLHPAGRHDGLRRLSPVPRQRRPRCIGRCVDDCRAGRIRSNPRSRRGRSLVRHQPHPDRTSALPPLRRKRVRDSVTA